MKKLLFLLLAVPLLAGDYVSGAQTCPSSGNIQVSTTNYQLFQLTITANTTNAAKIYLGGSTVDTSHGAFLIPGASFNDNRNNPGINPATLYMACVTSGGDGITWTGGR